MVSKKERLSGLYNGVRCTICGRKLTHPQSVDRQIGPSCWKKLGNEDNHKLPIHRGQIRCKKCGVPKQDLRQHILWREKWDVLCTQFCCTCCPENKPPCPMILNLQRNEMKQEVLEVSV